MPSLACASATAARLAAQQRSSTLGGHSRPAQAAAAAPEAPGSCCAAAGKALPAVDARDAVYLLNPSGDLPATQSTFEGLFRQQRGWQVCRAGAQSASAAHLPYG